MLIGLPIGKLIREGQKQKLDISLGKGYKLSTPISHTLKTRVELLPERDPIEEINAAFIDKFLEPSIDGDDAQFFIEEEEEEPSNPEPLDELLEPPKPPIELKPLPSGLKYVFLNNAQESLVIISDKLSQEESLRLITILEKHRAALRYSLQDLKGSSPVLCTHCIPTNPEVTPTKEPQHRLNNAMREVVKKEVLKLLHAGIMYPMPHSEWVSPVQVVPRKGGMTVVQNDRNDLIPKMNHHMMADVHRL